MSCQIFVKSKWPRKRFMFFETVSLRESEIDIVLVFHLRRDLQPRFIKDASGAMWLPPPDEVGVAGWGTEGRCRRPLPPALAHLDLLQSPPSLSPTHMPRFTRKDGTSSEGHTLERKRPPFIRPSFIKKEPGRTRMDGASRSGGSIAGDIETAPDYLSRQNIDLRRRLEDEAATYRRRLETYKQAQQQQAALVSRLQAKVLQYKQRCSELEGQMEEVLDRPSVVAPPGSALEAAQQQLRELREERVSDLDTAIRALHEEKRKSEKLAQLNLTLRQQLEEAHESNEALTSDLQKLTSDWEVMREEMMIKEDEWKEEEQCFNDYYSNEHARLLTLWRDVVAMKRYFTEMQSATQRDLIKMKGDLSNTSRNLMDTCAGIHVRQSRYNLAEEESKQQNVEEITQLKEALIQLRAEREQVAMEAKIKEEKIQALNKDCRSLEERCTAAETTIGDVTKLQAELELLQSALRDIAHAVLQDAETRDPDTHHVHLTPSQPLPPRSPKRTQRTPTSPVFVESTISAVQAALHKNQLQIHELQVKLSTCKEQCSTWKKQAETCEESHKTLESRLSECTAQLDTTKALVTQLTQEKDMIFKSLESARAEKNALDKNRLEMNAMLDSINTDYEKEKKLTVKLQKAVDTLEDDKSYLLGEIEQLKKEAGISPVFFHEEKNTDTMVNSEKRKSFFTLCDKVVY